MITIKAPRVSCNRCGHLNGTIKGAPCWNLECKYREYSRGRNDHIIDGYAFQLNEYWIVVQSKMSYIHLHTNLHLVAALDMIISPNITAETLDKLLILI